MYRGHVEVVFSQSSAINVELQNVVIADILEAVGNSSQDAILDTLKDIPYSPLEISPSRIVTKPSQGSHKSTWVSFKIDLVPTAVQLSKYDC